MGESIYHGSKMGPRTGIDTGDDPMVFKGTIKADGGVALQVNHTVISSFSDSELEELIDLIGTALRTSYYRTKNPQG